MRGRVAAAVALGAALALTASPALGRRHHVHAVPAPLPRSLAVDEREWAIQPSQTTVAAGTVTFRAYDRGMDPHNVTVIGPHGTLAAISLLPGRTGAITARLRPGIYRLVCTLFAGTPESHEKLGMHSTIRVR